MKILPRLNPLDELELFKKVENGDMEAREKIILHNINIVYSIAKKYKRMAQFEFEDIVQYGIEGLITAVGKFDYRKGNKFSTYAYYWIKQSIIRAFYSEGKTIRLPEHVHALQNAIVTTYNDLRTELEREPTTIEIAESMDEDPEKIAKLWVMNGNTASYDNIIEEDDGTPYSTFLSWDGDIEAELNLMDHRKAIKEVLETANLEEEELSILCMHYGLFGYPETTMATLAKKNNVSKNKMKEKVVEIIEKLRGNNEVIALLQTLGY